MLGKAEQENVEGDMPENMGPGRPILVILLGAGSNTTSKRTRAQILIAN